MDEASLVALLDRAAGPDSDPSEVARAKEVVNALFVAHERRVYALCYRFVGDREQARELAQDTLLTAYRKLGEWEGTGTFWAWLYGIARFKCLNALNRKQDLLTEDGLIEEADPARSVLAGLRRQERIDVVRAASQAVLSELEQEAVYLRYVEGLSQDRITRILALSERSGARGLLQRSRRKLSRELSRRLVELGHGASFFQESRG